MRKINFTKRLLTLAAALALFSCTGSRDLVSEEGGDAPKQKEFSFVLNMPAGDAVKYPVSKARAIHDRPEWTLGSLYMYIFDANTGNAVGEPKDIKPDLVENTTAEASWIYTFTQTDETAVGVFKFIFVANENPGKVNTLADLEAKLASKQLTATGQSSKDLLADIGTDANLIPMTGFAYQGSKADYSLSDVSLAGSVRSAKVELTRIVARVDIQNLIPKLVIRSLKIKNTNDRSHLLVRRANTGQPTFVAPAAATMAEISSFVQIGADGHKSRQDGGSDEGWLKKAFYLYEGAQDADKGITTIELDCMLGSRPIKLLVPFRRSSQDPTSPLVDIKRNHIYRIILGDNTPLVDGANVKFKIEDTPWNGVLLNEEWNPIHIDGHYVESFRTHWDRNSYTLYTSSSTDSDKSDDISLVSNYKGHNKFTVELKFEDENDKWFTYTFEETTPGKAFIRINTPTSLGSNDKKSRSAWFTVWSDADPDNKMVITHTQVQDLKSVM